MESKSNGYSTESTRRLLVIRHGERIDFTFNSGRPQTWVEQAFDSKGKYRRFNINMPKSVPMRRDGWEKYEYDTPLTEMGYLQAKIAGRALKDAGVKPTCIYVSPAYRCVQTSVGLLKGMGNNDIQLNIEPGLFEWGMWFQKCLPSWMTASELQAQSFPINESYKPLYSTLNNAESLDDFYKRSFLSTKAILERHPEKDSTVVIVAHGACLDTCTRHLTGKLTRSQQEFYRVLHATPYLSVAAAQEQSGGIWKLTHPPIQPFQHQANASYDWTCLN